MGGAVALLLGLALGQERALVLVEGPAAHDDDAEARVLEAMVGSPYEQIAVVPGDHIDELVRVVGVEVLDPSCDGPVSLGSWNTRLELARQQAQLLDVRSSLATLSMLDLELSCLDSALQVRVAEEFFVELGRTHVLAAEMDPRTATFHMGQARAAVDALMALEATVPSDLRPLSVDPGPSWVVGGGPLGQVLIDGREVSRAVLSVPAGPHLVQVVEEGRVVASMRLQLAPEERALLWAGEAFEGALSVETSMVARGVEVSALLPYAALVVEEPLVIASVGDGPVRLYSPSGQPLRFESARIPPRTVAVEVDLPAPPPWSLGAAPAVAWHRGAVSGFAGGVAVNGRYRWTQHYLVSAVVQPQLRRERLPAAYDLEHVWRMTVPLRLGVHRVGTKTELGPELGLVVNGPGLGVDLAALLALRHEEKLGGLSMTVDLYGGGGPRGALQAGLAIGLQRGL